MRYIKEYFSNIETHKEHNTPTIGDYVLLTDEFYDEKIKDISYVTKDSLQNKKYRKAIGEIIDINFTPTLEYLIYFDKYEFWREKYDLETIATAKQYNL